MTNISTMNMSHIVQATELKLFAKFHDDWSKQSVSSATFAKLCKLAGVPCLNVPEFPSRFLTIYYINPSVLFLLLFCTVYCVGRGCIAVCWSLNVSVTKHIILHCIFVFDVAALQLLDAQYQCFLLTINYEPFLYVFCAYNTLIYTHPPFPPYQLF